MKTKKPSKNLKYFIPEIIEFLVTVSIVSISDIFFQTDASTNIILGVIGLSTATLTLAIRQIAAEQIIKIDEKIEVYRLLNEISHPDLLDQGVEAVEECVNKLRQLAGGIDLSMSGWMTTTEDYEHAISRQKQAQTAIQMVNSDFLRLAETLFEVDQRPFIVRSPGQADAIKRGISVELITLGRLSDLSLLPPEKLAAQVEAYQNRVEHGVKVWLLWIDKLDPRKVFQPNFLICDDTVQYYNNPLRDSNYRQVTVTYNSQTVDEYKKRFETWKRLAVPFTEVPEFQQFLQSKTV